MTEFATALSVAIAAAAPIAGKELVGCAVKDAYAGIRNIIKEKFKRGAAVAAVEEAPESKGAQSGLASALIETRAVDDPDVRRLAKTLVEALRSDPKFLPRFGMKMDLHAIGKILIDSNTTDGGMSITASSQSDITVANNKSGGTFDPKS